MELSLIPKKCPPEETCGRTSGTVPERFQNCSGTSFRTLFSSRRVVSEKLLDMYVCIYIYIYIYIIRMYKCMSNIYIYIYIAGQRPTKGTSCFSQGHRYRFALGNR